MTQDKKQQDNSVLIKRASSIIANQQALKSAWDSKHKGKGPLYKVLHGQKAYQQDPEAGKELISIYKKLGVKNLKEFNALKSKKQTGGLRDSFLEPGIENLD
jgi:hypothetical protein